MTVTIERTPDGSGRILRSEVVVPAPLDRAFACFADPAMLQATTPPWVDFRVLTPPPAPATLRDGLTFHYRIRLYGVPVRWHSRIEDCDVPATFVDRQLRGPYASWHHRHEFEAIDAEHTTMRDIVHFRSPFAAITDPLFVVPALRRIFAWREQHLARIVELARP